MATKLKPADAITVTKLHPRIGAEIGGVDLSRETAPDTMAAINQAWYDHAVLLFRDQHMSDEDQLRFAANFGPIAERVVPPAGAHRPSGPDWTNIMYITDGKDADGNPLGSLGHGEMWFHSDKCYRPEPHRASFLYGIDIPTEGGHTKFASLYSAYDNMPDALKTRLADAFVMQGYDYGVSERLSLDVNLEDILHYAQPMILTHPDSGRKSLYITRLNTMWIEGMDRDESDAILEELFALTEAEDNYYEHVWRPGDLVMWDNLACLHARTDWPQDQLRTLRRCTVVGEKLY
ncbi:MAG: hypothetical protein GEU92_17715 [Alphaproteobacteria bacterium]|nr:hypothetical protein [Alphaproteobacteria bacterium]